MFTILIVEDNLVFREALHDSLRAHFPFLLLAKADGVREALATVDSTRPQVIFLDLRLPDGNGMEFTRRLRAAGNDALIAVFTSHDLPEYREESLRSGADQFLVKGSASLSDIFGVVESALDSRFRALVVAEDATFRDRMCRFISRTWPDTLLDCAMDRDQALETALTLKPHLVVLRSGTSAEIERGFCEAVRAHCTGVGMSVVSIRGGAGGGAQESPADHCLAEGAESGQEMVRIVNSLRDARGKSKS